MSIKVSKVVSVIESPDHPLSAPASPLPPAQNHETTLTKQLLTVGTRGSNNSTSLIFCKNLRVAPRMYSLGCCYVVRMSGLWSRQRTGRSGMEGKGRVKVNNEREVMKTRRGRERDTHEIVSNSVTKYTQFHHIISNQPISSKIRNSRIKIQVTAARQKQRPWSVMTLLLGFKLVLLVYHELTRLR